MNDLIIDIDDEFDIQKTVLKKRKSKTDNDVYVEYDSLRYNVIAISPNEIKSFNRRNKVTKLKASELTDKIFANRLPLAKLRIKKNQETGNLELAQNNTKQTLEFDFIFVQPNVKSFIHLQCNIVTKTIYVFFDYNEFQLKVSKEIITESQLEALSNNIEIFCVDKREKSKLFDKITLDIHQLINQHVVYINAKWLPDNEEDLKNIGFLYQNNSQLITISLKEFNELDKEDNFIYRPNLLYKQEGNVLYLQSTMQNVDSFRLNSEIILYLYDKNDPSLMLKSITLESSQLNNYSDLNITLDTSKEIKIISNYSHIHIKESDANTYY